MRRAVPEPPRLRVLSAGRARKPGMRGETLLAGVAFGAIAWALVVGAILLVLWLSRVAGATSSSSTAIASVYTSSSAPGRMACTGERVDDGARTFASLIVPCGARVRFCRLDGRRCVIARRTDSGPFVAGRSFDLTLGVVDALGYAGLEFGVRAIRWERV